jgi:magnesium transporter
VSRAEHRRSPIRSLVRRRIGQRSEAERDDGFSVPDVLPSGDQRSRIVDSAIYVDGERVASPASLPETFDSLRQHPDGMAWIGLYRPEEQEVQSLASEFQLHPLAVEDAIHAHQRPKIERHDDTLFVVLRPARYVDDVEEVEFGEIHVFVGPRFVLTVRHSEAPRFGSMRRRLEREPEYLRRGPEAVLYAVLDKVVDGYYPVVAGVHHDIDEIEVEVFSGDPRVSRRIYELSREVADFLRATRPLIDVIAALRGGFAKYHVDELLQDHLRDVEDHLIQIIERVDEFRVALRDMLTVNATLVAQRQNEEMRSLAEAANAQNEEVKKISAWAAILFAPTLIGTIYGMNFVHLPELDWLFGYPFALVLMAVTCLGLYALFKRRRWL